MYDFKSNLRRRKKIAQNCNEILSWGFFSNQDRVPTVLSLQHQWCILRLMACLPPMIIFLQQLITLPERTLARAMLSERPETQGPQSQSWTWLHHECSYNVPSWNKLYWRLQDPVLQGAGQPDEPTAADWETDFRYTWRGTGGFWARAEPTARPRNITQPWRKDNLSNITWLFWLTAALRRGLWLVKILGTH